MESRDFEGNDKISVTSFSFAHRFTIAGRWGTQLTRFLKCLTRFSTLRGYGAAQDETATCDLRKPLLEYER